MERTGRRQSDYTPASFKLGGNMCKLIGARTAHSQAGSLWRDWQAALAGIQSDMAEMRARPKPNRWAQADDEELAGELLRQLREAPAKASDGVSRDVSTEASKSKPTVEG